MNRLLVVWKQLFLRIHKQPENNFIVQIDYWASSTTTLMCKKRIGHRTAHKFNRILFTSKKMPSLKI